MRWKRQRGAQFITRLAIFFLLMGRRWIFALGFLIDRSLFLALAVQRWMRVSGSPWRSLQIDPTAKGTVPYTATVSVRTWVRTCACGVRHERRLALRFISSIRTVRACWDKLHKYGRGSRERLHITSPRWSPLDANLSSSRDPKIRELSLSKRERFRVQVHSTILPDIHVHVIGGYCKSSCLLDNIGKRNYRIPRKISPR